MTAYTNKRKTKKEEVEEKGRLNQTTAVDSPSPTYPHTHTHTPQREQHRFFCF